MAQNKEQLNKLLLFIKRLIEEPGNEEFVNGLRKLLTVPIHGSVDNAKISDIEKYLGLDYMLDSATPDIDYLYINDNNVRNQLTSDYREMLRYRYGVRSHRVDFAEFCRYAMLQIEQLINYYYQSKFKSNDEIKEYINNRTKFIVEEVNSIQSLSLFLKLRAFLQERKDLQSLYLVRELRNEQSHRNVKDELVEINNFRKSLIDLGLPLKKDGEVDWFKIKQDENLRTKYEEVDKKAYSKYKYQLWRFREPFAEVLETVRVFSKLIADELKVIS